MQPLIVIAGPTASGKTAVAVKLAQTLDGEVISADSMLVYKGMDIGTAKPSLDEREGIQHHLIDVVRPDEPFSAARYQVLAADAIHSAHERGKIPILAGGTGFYINGVVYGCDFTPVEDTEEQAYRQHLNQLAEGQGNDYVHALLREVDPAAAMSIHPNNRKRVIRALSFFHFTGQSIMEHNVAQRENKPVYNVLYIVLHMDRDVLYNKINARVTDMLEKGLTTEVQKLLDDGYAPHLTAMQGLGYKETVRFLRGECTQAEAADAIRQGTRHYAKRQITWFKHRAQAHWMRSDQYTAKELAEQIIVRYKRLKQTPADT